MSESFHRVELPCHDPVAGADALASTFGLRLRSIFPADDPRRLELEGHGIRLALVRSSESDDSRGDGWHIGRAGMQYRDLVSDRLDGSLVASHIRIPQGGPVPDYVHWHEIEFQLIYCRRGWVKVVYEDQGEAFTMQEGDCVLQPPRIRHRVLESSDALEVIELSAPAEHETRVEHDLELPNDVIDASRSFEGQRFRWHRAADSASRHDPSLDCTVRDTELGAASGGRIDVRVLSQLPDRAEIPAATGFIFVFVLSGNCEISGREGLATDQCATARAGETMTILNATADAELLVARGNELSES